ncbi:GPI anchored serine-threonine rich family protein [Desulfatibacillum aliphaticivorans]|uniref:GPI anchored serine-threonine rich family protein n=1 Tax=Desulfatibacillum aliphaticivorans TaxID=218208 RepID=UPI00054EB9FD|nr:GPI anchored serine-threonine rich family protein [Desulfatibacillum aliphaticivorans]
MNFFNDYNSPGTIRIHIPEAVDADISLIDLISNEEIPTSEPMTIDYRSGRGIVAVAYLKKSQKAEIRVKDPKFDSNGHYPIYVDYFPDDNSNMSDMDWLEAAINRKFRSTHEGAITGYMRQLNGLTNAVSDLILGLEITDTVLNLGSSALVPKFDPTDAHKVLGYAVSTDQLWAAGNLISTANTGQKCIVSALPNEEVSLAAQNLSAVTDGLVAFGQLTIGHNPKDAYMTIISDFAKSAVYCKGVYDTSEIEKGINAQYLVKYLMAQHIADQNPNKFTKAYATYMCSEWADYTESECGWFKDKAGCGLDNYEEERVWELYSNFWDEMQTWITAHQIEDNWYADVDHDGYSNQSEIDMGTDPNDPLSPEPEESTLRITYPTSSSVYKAGDRVLLKWESSSNLQSSPISIYIITPSNSMDSLATNVPNKGSHCFLLPSFDPGDGYYLKIVAVDDPSVYSNSQSFQITEDDSNSEYVYPWIFRVYPEYIKTQNVRGGERIRFKVRAKDFDENLSHVIWSASDSLLPAQSRPYATSEYVQIKDVKDRLEGENGICSTNVVFLGKDVEYDFYVYATVYDTEGNTDSLYWIIEVEPTFSPQISLVFPAEEESNLGLGEHDLQFSVSDADGNLDRYEVYVDGALVKEDSISGGTSSKEIAVENVSFSEKKDYSVRVICYDKDNLYDQIDLTIHAGIVDGNVHRPIIEYACPDDIPYQLYRVDNGYMFEAKAVDEDGNLSYTAIKVNGNTIYEDVFSSESDHDIFKSRVFFEQEGSNTISFLAKDSGGEEAEKDIVLDVLPADGTGSIHVPQLLDVYPNGSKLYGEKAVVNIRFRDYDADIDKAELYNGSTFVDSFNIDSDCSESIKFDIPTGTNTLNLWLVDFAGNRVKAKTWTSYSTGGGSVAPQIITIGSGNSIYVKQGDSFKIRGYAFDASGDLDRIIFDCSDIGYDSTKKQYVSSMIDNFTQTLTPERSGEVLITAYDDAGNQSSRKTINVIVSGSIQSHAPQILFSTFEDGDTVLGYNNDCYLATDALAFDPDGDLVRLSFFVNGLETKTEIDSGEYSLGNHIYNYFKTSEFQNRYIERGATLECVIRAVDSYGNMAEKKFSVIGGPMDGNNHSPIVDAQKQLSLDQ